MLTVEQRQFAASDLQACAERELKLRRQVYENRIMTRRMSRQMANEEIAKMAAIVEHFAELAKQERLL